MKSPVAPLSRRAWTCCVCWVSMATISTSREREVAEGIEATMYWCSHLGMHTWVGGSGLAGERGGEGSMSVEVLTDFHTEESKEGFVFEDSTDRHIKQLELCSSPSTAVLKILWHILFSIL